MKKLLFLFAILLLFFFACTDSQKSSNETADYNINNGSKPLPTFFTNLTLENKVFNLGNETHFTNSCSFYFECDCCSGKLLFNADSTFFYIDYCMSDQIFRQGNYKVENDLLMLNFGQASVFKKYNYENEIDTSAVDYFMNDTLLKEVIRTYTVSKCDNQILLTDLDVKELAIESKENFNELTNYLKQEGFISLYEELNLQRASNIDKENVANQCSSNAVDFLALKDKQLQKTLFFKLDSVRIIQYPNNDQEKEIFVDLTPEYLDKFLEDINLDSLSSNKGFEKEYHFNIAPKDYSDPEVCQDKIQLIFDEEYCRFRLTIFNTFLVEPDWCTESNVVYGFQIQDEKITDFWRNEAG